jgi:hypothetical protein
MESSPLRVATIAALTTGLVAAVAATAVSRPIGGGVPISGGAHFSGGAPFAGGAATRAFAAPQTFSAPRVMSVPPVTAAPRVMPMPQIMAAPRVMPGPRVMAPPRVVTGPRVMAPPRVMPGPRVMAAPHFTPRQFAIPSAPRALARPVTPRVFAAPAGRPPQSADNNPSVTTGRALRLAGINPGVHALRNQALAIRPATGAFARTKFQGAFLGSPWRFRHHHRLFPIFVIGWAGPLFWPYASDDFIDYTFYPYAYDTFWPYAYDDLYVGIFGPYAPEVGGVVGKPPRGAAAAASVAVDICGGGVAGLTDWPIDRIAQAVSPDDAQRATLDELKTATAQALDILKAACPTELPATPTGRIEAMHKRLDAMLAAVRTLRPALDKFYQSLSDEQKARFNALGPEQNAAQPQSQRDLAQFCSARASGVASVPIGRIERAVRPADAQRVAFTELQDAVTAAVDQLRANCPTYRPLTPIGRIEAMQQRLEAMLTAVTTVEPALAKFYGLLSDEQKERFNRLSPAQS